ncbi:hypothetical protein BDW69DRAFT_189508 [Aspergillus filifer]
MADNRDGEATIYRKFAELSARNLLYLQCELQAIEKKIRKLDINDASSEDEALLLQSEITKLKRPNKRVLEAYRHWFLKPFPVLGGFAKRALDDTDDLVALSTLPEGDYLSMFLRRHWLEELTRDGLYTIGRLNETSIAVAVALIGILVASFILIDSIVGLYFATDDALKLGLVAGFTALFAISVGVMTNARRSEIFAATAACIPENWAVPDDTSFPQSFAPQQQDVENRETW